jgi:hypothetical protein
MTMKRTLFALAVLAHSTPPALAQKAAPGLWETSVQMQGADIDAAMAQMKQQMARLPPEQRKQVEAMMGQRGIGMGGAPNTTRVCISKAMAERGDVPSGDGRCTHQSMQRSGNKISFKYACAGNPPSSGEGEYTFDGDKAYRGRMVMNTVRDGKPQRMEMNVAGRFVSSDCGAIKPLN